jgi:TetR/AcrR family transcriptional regulator, transcriptional repressor for nem operon
MAGRPKIFDERDVIRKASEIFWKKGYEASSAEELLEAMNIGKGSFYLHFKGGKKELYQRSLELFSTEAMERFNKNLANAPDEVEFLKQFILSLADSADERKQKGCYLGNGVVEMSNLDNKTKDQAGMLLNKLEKAFAAIIKKAQLKGDLTTKVDPLLLGKYLINLRNGIHVTARTEKDSTRLRKMIELSLEIIK